MAAEKPPGRLVHGTLAFLGRVLDKGHDPAGHARDYAFFHWPIEFPQLFSKGGFDIVLGNPPWERIKLQEKEFFSSRVPEIAEARNAAERKRLIRALEREDPALWTTFRQAVKRAEGEGHLLRQSGRYPLASRGDINTYPLFVELMRSLVSATGLVGVIVPTGLATDETTSALFGDLVRTGGLRQFLGFSNKAGFFPEVGSMVTFAVVAIVGVEREAAPAEFMFGAESVSEVDDEERRFTLAPEEFALLNPNSRTCPTFRSRRDADITKDIYQRVPVLRLREGPSHDAWGVSFLTMFHMTNDAPSFRDSPGVNLAPMYEAKLFHQFNHRWATFDGDTARHINEIDLVDPGLVVRPRYWVDDSSVEAALAGKWDRHWLLCVRGIARSTDERTVISSVIPRAGVGNSAPIAMSREAEWPLVVANLCSIVLDWVARQKIGGPNLNFFILEQFPILPPSIYRAVPSWTTETLAAWLRRYVCELVYTSWDLAGYAEDLGWSGSPFQWSERRILLRAELDAAYLHLYGVSHPDAEYMIDSFVALREHEVASHGTYRTKALVLDAYDSMAVASSKSPFVSRLTPAPGDPQVAHPVSQGASSAGSSPWGT